MFLLLHSQYRTTSSKGLITNFAADENVGDDQDFWVVNPILAVRQHGMMMKVSF